MNEADPSTEEELTRLAIRLISAAQGALEAVLAPGGVVETVGAAVAGLIDEVSSPRPEVKEHLAEAANALGLAWQALVRPDEPATGTEEPPPLGEA